MDREEIIDKHKCLLDKMKEDRIFSICFENNAVYLNEQCDDYFLTNSQKKTAWNYQAFLVSLQL